MHPAQAKEIKQNKNVEKGKGWIEKRRAARLSSAKQENKKSGAEKADTIQQRVADSYLLWAKALLKRGGGVGEAPGMQSSGQK